MNFTIIIRKIPLSRTTCVKARFSTDWNVTKSCLQPAFEEVLKRSVLDAQSAWPRNAASSSQQPSFKVTTRNHASSFKPSGVVTNGAQSNANQTEVDDQAGTAQWAKKQELKRRIAEMDADINGLKESIQTLNTQLRSKEDNKEGMVRILNELERASRSGALQSSTAAGSRVNGQGKSGRVQQGINYMDGEFDWMGGLKARMKSVFGISDFRLCQRGYVLPTS